MRIFAALIVSAVLAGCGSDDVPEPHPARSLSRSAPTAIGESCIGCHAEIVRSYRQTGMAHALGPIEQGELDGLAPVADAAFWR